jgi:PAS domain S-box-containing protein
MKATRDPNDKIHTSVYQHFLSHKPELNKRMRDLFQSFAFENRYPLHPSKLADLAHDATENLLAFLSSKKPEDVFRYGGKGVNEGIGDKTILALSAVLRDFCWDKLFENHSELLHKALCAVDTYMASFVEGFMAKREAQILRDQEQMRRALSAALRRQRLELHVKDHAINTYINGIILTDLDGRVTYVNSAFLAMWGHNDASEILGKDYIEFVKFEGSQDNSVFLANHRKGGWRGEVTVQRDEGFFLELEVTISSILDDSGNPLGVMASFMDISDRKRLEAEFRQAQRMEAVNTLASGMAHDFNNLLTTILGNTSLMLMDIDPTHSHYERLKTIEDQVESGSKLTKQLLGYARKGKYEVKPINLNQLVRETSETFARTRKELTIHIELDQNLAAIEADRGQIEQVLLNMYINAADAMPDGGELTLRTRNILLQESKHEHADLSPGNYIVLSVTDTGMGIDQKTVERIFDPFFTTKEMGRGVGLGLASAYGIIKNHGGHIEVNTTRGIGTTFLIYLPPTAKEKSVVEEPVEQVVEKKEALLVVDDEELVLDTSVKLLRAMGYTVFGARSGREALGIFQSERDKIGLVILDMVMPVMSGGETFDRLKQIDPEVKVLLASGYSINGQATDILNRGCDGFIQKPFRIGDLLKKIVGIMEVD